MPCWRASLHVMRPLPFVSHRCSASAAAARRRGSTSGASFARALRAQTGHAGALIARPDRRSCRPPPRHVLMAEGAALPVGFHPCRGPAHPRGEAAPCRSPRRSPLWDPGKAPCAAGGTRHAGVPRARRIAPLRPRGGRSGGPGVARPERGERTRRRYGACGASRVAPRPGRPARFGGTGRRKAGEGGSPTHQSRKSSTVGVTEVPHSNRIVPPL